MIGTHNPLLTRIRPCALLGSHTQAINIAPLRGKSASQARQRSTMAS